MPIETVIEAEEILRNLEAALNNISYSKAENRVVLTDKELDLKLKISRQRMALEHYLKEVYNNYFPKVIIEVPISDSSNNNTSLSSAFNLSREIASKYPNLQKIALNFERFFNPDSGQYRQYQKADFSLYFKISGTFSNSLKLFNLNKVPNELLKETSERLVSCFRESNKHIQIDSPPEAFLEKSISLGMHILIGDLLTLIERGITSINPSIIDSKELVLTYEKMPVTNFYEIKKASGELNNKTSLLRYDKFD